jgi:putative DNA primase/helicase
MSCMKELLFPRKEVSDVGGLDEIAAALGGEVDGRLVCAPSPGCSADDRSLVVRIDPARPDSFYVYACNGDLGPAIRQVRAKLKLVEPTVEPTAERTAAAQAIWSESVPAVGTLVQTYLCSRAITLSPPPTLRFHGALRHSPTRDKRPAMVAEVTDVSGHFVGIHRTWLKRDGSGKADIECNRMTLGAIGGAAVRLAAVADELAVGEGIETCLSVMQATGMPVWAALSTTGLKTLVLPTIVKSVAILADADAPGELAANEAAIRWLGEGRSVRIARPPAGKDFNDLLIEGAT